VSMYSGLNHRFRVSDVVIGDNPVQVDANAIFEVFGKRLGFRILDMVEPKVAATLSNADYNFFLGSMGTASATLHAADVGFVHFDGAVEHWLISGGHCRADSVTEIPCRLIASDSERALNLASRNSLFGFAKQQDCEKPLSQWQMGIMEHSS